MAAETKPTKSSPKQTHSSRPPPRRPPRPAPIRSPPQPIPSSYGSISPFISPQSSLTLSQHSIQPSSFPPTAPIGLNPSPSPLARVPSRLSLRPFLQIDFDAVAEQLSTYEGAPVTGEDLRNSFPAAHHHQQQPCSQDFSTAPTASGSFQASGTATPAVPLHVEFAQDHDLHSDDQGLTITIRPMEEASDVGNDINSQNEFEIASDAAKGFAMSIPVNPEPLHPSLHTVPVDSSENIDEETPILEQQGIDLAPHSDMNISSEATATVQRHGSKHDIEEQEVVVSMPESANVGPNTGFIIPNYDSRENLTDLLVVVPPEQEEDPNTSSKMDGMMTSTAETAKEAIEQFTSFVPPMPSIVDIESTVEVRGSAKSATLTMNVRREVSVVGYLILAIALFSVASQGTAVKWLPSVDGMIAAAWLMQCQTWLMVPFALFQYLTLSDEERWQLKQPSTMKLMAVASFSQVFWACGFFLAIDYTSMFHAWSLNNIHALSIVLVAVGRGMLSKQPSRVVSAGELLGARIAIGGLILMQIPNLLSMDVRSTCGDMIAALSSLGAIVYLDSCKELRQRVPLFLMMAPISALNSITFAFSSMIIAGTDFSVTDHGALGWLQPDRLLLGLYLGGVVGFLGSVSCIAALKYLPNVVVGSVQTMMPVVGTIVAVLMGAESLPDLWTTLGGAVLLYGVLVIADATRQSEITVVLNEHLTADTRT
ncbi:unnamed protein product [Agarophyton chilense]|eukprot:gb/GEZJ01001100.1/.p1 GENE.gb/GEZJ01001100.1/~~gb/GEZJ01001100.1/.p1  ORF type:complete len:709 (-),score=82.61 gb/GEZJ01001100.1/:714-2840(-)